MTTVPPLEIELKLKLPPDRLEAFRKRMARRRATPVEQDLVTRYFDTPDFALSGAGVALRVRRAGRRWLQTLKTEGERQGGLSRRIEYEMPVRSGALDWTRFPAQALARVPEALRGAVVPVFETQFHRTAWQIKGRGGALIEVALDVGEVVAGDRTQPVCEVELELKAGQPDALFDLALDWAGAFGCLPFDMSKAERGVRLAHSIEAAPTKAAPAALAVDMTVEEGFTTIVQSCLAQFQANLPGVLASPDIEYVHQARVALRRLRAALRLFRRACVLPDELTEGLRSLVEALGPARDWDVLLGEVLPKIAPQYGDADAWQRGVEALEIQRREVRVAMRDALQRAQPGVWLLAMHRWLLRRGWRSPPNRASCSSVGTLPDAPALQQLARLDAWARRALKRGHRRIVRRARVFDQLRPQERHTLRIAIKRQRYAAEFFQALLPAKREARYLAVLRDAQDALGRANDAHIALELMRQADAGPMGEFVRGWLAAQVASAGAGESAALMRRFLDTDTYW